MIHKWGGIVVVVALGVPSITRADEASAVRVRFSSDASGLEVEHAACAMRTVFEAGGRGVAFDVSVGGRRCGNDPKEPDAITLDVQVNEPHAVIVESDSDAIARADLESAVERAARDLRRAILAAKQPKHETEPELTTEDIHRWKDGDAVPHGYHVESRLRVGLIATGAGMFAFSYGTSVILAATESSANSSFTNWLYVPVAGPFVAATACFVLAPFTAGLSGLFGVAFVFEGIVQTTGLALSIYGAASPKKHLVLDGGSALRDVMPMPFVTRDAAGIGVTGRF